MFSCFPDIDWHLKGRWGDLPRLTPCLTINSTKSLYLAAQQGIGICSGVFYANVIYGGSLVQVLPAIEGPTVYVYFCTKKEMSQKLEKNVNIFSAFFINHLESIGISMKGEKETDI